MARRSTAFKTALAEAKAETARYIQTLRDESVKKQIASQGTAKSQPVVATPKVRQRRPA
jgi:hypothetical protein